MTWAFGDFYRPDEGPGTWPPGPWTWHLAPAEKVETPGYFAEGWSAKDLVAHIGS